MRSFCIAQGTIFSHLWWNVMEDMRKIMYVYIYVCVCVCVCMYIYIYTHTTGSVYCTEEIDRTLEINCNKIIFKIRPWNVMFSLGNIINSDNYCDNFVW